MNSESIARILNIVAAIVLLVTGIMPSTPDGLLLIFLLSVAIAVVAANIGNRGQKIISFIIMGIGISLSIWAIK